jgi:hypothetical protein
MRSCNWLNFLATFYMRANMLTCFYNKPGLLIPAFLILILIFMKVVFGSIVTDGSGKLGGQVITKNHYGRFQKTKVTPANPKTSRQLAVRANFKAVQTAWETLSETNRLLWNNCVSDYPQKDRFGDTHILSGYGLFMKCNVSRLNIGQLVLESPPVKFSFPNWSVVGVSAFAITGKVWLFMSPTIPAGNRLELFATSSVSPGINYMHWSFKQIGFVLPSQGYPVDISSMYSTIFPSGLTVNKKVFFKARMINDASGFISHEVKFSCIIQDGLSANLGLNWFNTYAGVVAGAMYDVKSVNAYTIISVSGTPAGVFKSVDGGSVFVRKFTGVASTNLQSLVRFSDGTLLASQSAQYFMLRSIDVGETWSNGTSFIQADWPYKISMDSKDNLAWGGYQSGKIFLSTDKGLTYTLRSIPFPGYGIYRTWFDLNDNLWASSITGKFLAYSSDLGLTWNRIVIPFTYTAIRNLTFCGNGIIIATATGNNGFFRTIDSGLTWLNVNPIAGSDYVTSLSKCLNGVLIACTWNIARVYRSVDFGLTWSLVGNPLYGQSYYNFDWAPNGKLFASTYNSGIIVYSNP